MSSDSNLEILLSKLEEIIDSHELNFSQTTKVLNQENICNLFNILKQQTEQLRQAIEQQKNSELMVQDNQQLLSSFILHIPVAIAILDREMHYLAVSDRFVDDYQLKKNIIGLTHYKVFPKIPPDWRQDYQDCIAGKVEVLKHEKDFGKSDGKIDKLLWEIHPWRNFAGQISGLLIFSQLNIEKILLQEKLKSCEAQMRAVFAGMNELVFTVELNSNSILILPTKFFDLYDDIIVNQIIEKTQAQLFHDPIANKYQTLIQKILQTQQGIDFEYSLQLDDLLIWFCVDIAPVSETSVIWVAKDITQRKEAELNNLFIEKELAQVTLESIGDAVITTDDYGRVKYINPIGEHLTGWQSEEALGKPLAKVFQMIQESTQKPVINPIEKVVQENNVYRLPGKNLLIARNGKKKYAIEGLVSPIKDRQGKIIGAVITFRDVTQARRIARKLAWQASHDPLTRLCNRSKFEEYVARAIKDARYRQSHHALCYLDLDRFKIVNDTCGHAAGDELLRQISKLLSKRIRTLDVFARVGGDEFGILFHQCSIKMAQTIANQLRQLIEEFRFVWEDKVFRVGVSIGLVEITATTQSLTNLLSTTDAACYAAKERGGNCVYLYHEHDILVAQQRGERQWIEKLNRALEEDRSLDALPSAPVGGAVKQSVAEVSSVVGTAEPFRGSHRFCLYAQKIMAIEKDGDRTFQQDTSSQAKDVLGCSHYEILLRLIDDSGKIIAPGAFLPAAERYGLMPAIDRWVITTFLTGYEIYCQSRQEQKLEPISHLYTINLSGASINSLEFNAFLQQQFARYAISPATICFEITETVAIANLNDAVILIRQLKELGCSIALDDFGSGMSSLTYLKNLPVDYLKIDGSFVTNIAEDEIDYATVECFNHISQIMNIKTIAEFVESKAILQNLRQIGIDYAQGYGIERPQPLIWR